MISSTTILNFLSHQDTTLEFSPGVNIIVGATDSGKSAIIKALRWVVTNRPMGDGMRSSWGGLTSVGLLVDNRMVFRQRDQGLNKYLIADQEFNAIKGDVPAEVVKALNLSDINLQTQFDSHFLLSKSPGEVAQTFNKVAHLDRIDVALQNIQRGTREAQRKLEYDKQSLEANTERLLTYDSLPEIEGLIKALEDKETTAQRQANKRQEVIHLISSINSVEEELAEIEFLTDLEEIVAKVLDNVARLKVFEIEKIHIRNHIQSLKDIEDKLVDIDVFIGAGDIIDLVLELMRNQKHLKNQLASLTMLLGSLQGIEYEIQAVDKDVSKYEKEFHKALGKGTACPLCGSIIK